MKFEVYHLLYERVVAQFENYADALTFANGVNDSSHLGLVEIREVQK